MSWGTKKQEDAAVLEGWEVFEASGSVCNREGNWPFQIQYIHDQDELPDDVSAHYVVVEGAKAGKAHAINALKFLRRESKPELDLILREQLQDGVRWEDSLRTHDKRLDELETAVFGKVLTNV